MDQKKEIQKFSQEEKVKNKGKPKNTIPKSARRDLASLDNRNSGDSAERKVFNKLEEIFEMDVKDSSDVIMMHGLHIGAFIRQLGIDESEADFVLFLPKRKLIILIEVKNVLSPSSQASVSKQLQRSMKLLEEFFYDIIDDGDWHFCACAYFPDKSHANICCECDKWTLSKDEDFKTFWDEIKRLCPVANVDDTEQKETRRKTLEVVRLLLFTIHMRLPSTVSRSVEEIVELLQRIGDPHNILFWSKEQYELLTTETHELVLLKAGYGAGKSILLETKCENVAQKGIRCLYILGGKKNKKPTLLHWKLKNKWKNNPNIMLRSYNEIIVSKKRS